MSTLAQLVDAIPVVASAADRTAKFPSPVLDQRVYNKTTGAIERWTGTWVTDFQGILGGTLTLTGPVVIGTDPVGPEILRVGGAFRFSAVTSSYLFGTTAPVLSIRYTGAAGTQKYIQLSDNVSQIAYIDVGTANTLVLNSGGPVSAPTGPLIVGTDPGGPELLRAGGTTRLNGSVGIGLSSGTDRWLNINAVGGLSGVNNYGIVSGPTFPSTATTAGYAIYASLSTSAVAFTMTSGYGLFVDTGVKGAGSVITTQYGLYVSSQALGATNYAIYTNAGLVHFGDLVEVSNGTVTGRLQPNGSANWFVTTITNHPLVIGTNSLGRWSFDTSGNLVADPTNGGTVQSRIGTSTAVAKHSQVLYQNQGLSTTSTGEVSLASFSLPANSLAANGQAIRITVCGRYPDVNSAHINLKFGATSAIGVTTAATDAVYIVAHVTRTGATTQLLVTAYNNKNSTSTVGVSATETLSGAVTIDFRGNTNTSGTLFFDYIMVEYLAA